MTTAQIAPLKTVEHDPYSMVEFDTELLTFSADTHIIQI